MVLFCFVVFSLLFLFCGDLKLPNSDGGWCGVWCLVGFVGMGWVFKDFVLFCVRCVDYWVLWWVFLNGLTAAL